MGRCTGRAWANAAALWLTIGALLKPAFAFGQEDEVIVDPELSGPAGKASSSSGADGDEVIADPELGGGAQVKRPEDYGWGDVYKKEGDDTPAAAPPQAKPEDEPDPMANTGIGKLELIGQTAIDMHHEGSLEDFYEARLRLGGEVDFRMSRRLRLSLGTRLDFGWYAPYQGDPALKNRTVYEPELPRGADGAIATRTVNLRAIDQDRYELDLVPLAAYIDGTPTDGLHIRFGTQVISLGRMDGFSVTDMLAVLDFRPQAKADPSSLKLAQPAVRLDWDMGSWATLQLVYVPWFMPHLMRSNRDTYVGSALTTFPTSASIANRGRSASSDTIDHLIDPSWQTHVSETTMRFVGPPPDFTHPQAEARVNFRGSGFELALLGGTALEKLPAVYYTGTVNNALVYAGSDRGIDALGKVAAQSAAGFSVIDIEYHRYYLMGIDGSFDISPIQIGFEFAYSPSRHLYAVGKNHDTLPLPDVAPAISEPQDPIAATGTKPAVAGQKSNVTSPSIRKGTQMIQAALHAEYLKGEELALIAELYLFQVFSAPHDKSREWLGFPAGSGTYVGGLIGGSYAFLEGKYRFDVSSLLMMGPSAMITPQFEAEVADGFYLNIGAQIYEGPTPNNVGKNGVPKPNTVATNLTPGGVLSGYDNVYLGFRWVP